MILRTIKKHFFLPFLLSIAQPTTAQGFLVEGSIVSSKSQGSIISLKIPLELSHINCEQSQYYMEVFEELALVSEYPSVYKYYSEFATDIILKKQDLDIALDF
jgi:hypothetical protein